MYFIFPSFNTAPALPYLQHPHPAPPAVAFSWNSALRLKKRPRRSKPLFPHAPSSSARHTLAQPRGSRPEEEGKMVLSTAQVPAAQRRATKPRGEQRGNIPNPSPTSGPFRATLWGRGWFWGIFFLTDTAPCAEPPSEASGGAAPLPPRPGRSLPASEACTQPPTPPRSTPSHPAASYITP